MNRIDHSPTILTPWFVVYHEMPDGHTAYFRDEIEINEKVEMYTKIKGLARVFNNIRDAARVASAEKAAIRVLVTSEDAQEFGHDG